MSKKAILLSVLFNNYQGLKVQIKPLQAGQLPVKLMDRGNAANVSNTDDPADYNVGDEKGKYFFFFFFLRHIRLLLLFPTYSAIYIQFFCKF